ncbi:histone-lysine N-methyltransferase SETMAR [Trichonephila clavipes]|uniref:Histone-lysine N-methyltransferase SETMAR n=1 Tax=Trichonephila clavipes TaxID=2585209 RepID=A0A8X6VXE3_TRICX|nr:histone-lysine N-methyltransferase SETMAR [Trichonephila clavipes]
MSAADIHRHITELYGTEAMSDNKVDRKWVRKFKDGRTNVHDEERTGGQPSVITDDLMQAVETKIRENKRFTITTLSMEFLDISRSVVYKIVTEDLNFKKLCYWWVLRLLTAEHKDKRFAILLDVLIRYDEEGDGMLSRIVARDETWVSHITLESKQRSMQWRNTSSPVKVKAKQTLSKRKIMTTGLCFVLVDFMPQGTTMNSGVYCATLWKLRRALQNKRRGKLSKGVLLLHDNARSQTF